MPWLPLAVLSTSQPKTLESARPDAGQAHGLVNGSIFAGHYQCGSSAWLLLHLEEVSEVDVSAVFHFVYPSSSQHGAYTMSGQFSTSEGRLLRLHPKEWVDRPPGKVEPVGLAGVISPDGLRIKGEIMHLGCDGFDVNRTKLDVDAGTWRFPEMRVRGSRVPPLDMALAGEGSIAQSKDGREALQIMVSGVTQLVEEVRRDRAARQLNDVDDSSVHPFPIAFSEEEEYADKTEYGAEQRAIRSQLVQEERHAPSHSRKADLDRGATASQMLQRRRWAEAYSSWAKVAPEAKRKTAVSLLGALASIDVSSEPQLQRDVLRALATFGGVEQADIA
ncbi:MAG: hypothetical protein SGPRY_008088 [Prymnesium sp.]